MKVYGKTGKSLYKTVTYLSLYFFVYRKKEKKGKDKRPISQEQKEEEPVRDPVKEAELLLLQRFRTFDDNQKKIDILIDHWDRTTATIRPSTPSDGQLDGLDEGVHMPHPPSGRKVKKGGVFDLCFITLLFCVICLV